MLIGFAIVLGLVLLIGVLFVNLSPQFGGKPTKEQQQEYAKSDNYLDGKFGNIDGVKAEMSSGDMVRAIRGMFRNTPDARPNPPIEVHRLDSTQVADYRSETRFIWFGHSTILLQIDAKNILIDPMLSEVPAPHPLLGGKRFAEELPLELKSIPKIDAVLISHDHYDHLDYPSIKTLKDRVDRFYVPLGVSAHLLEWDIPKDKIVELDWWEEETFKELKFISTPSQHFSGRGLTDRDRTLWTSWIIQSETENIYFSGDSGYAKHFREIGEKYGPFDLAMVECGQYNELWPEVHMFPEQTIQAGLDLKARKVMPIHWGAFKLALHSWKDPIERAMIQAKAVDMPMLVPEIGVPSHIDSTSVVDYWWEEH